MPQGSGKRRIIIDDARDNGESPSDEEPPRGTQRRRRQVSESDESEDNEEIENGDSIARDELEVDGAGIESKAQLVKKLVRYALACEYSRIPIKRDGIKEKVFGKHRTPFKQIFDAAQEQLRSKFGMEMVELPVKEKVTLKDRRAAQKIAQGLASSKSYILTSTLPAPYRVPAILTPSKIPTVFVEASYTALYTMIISLISLCGGTLADVKLERYLKRMNADINMPIDKTEAALQKMIKQGYLVKVKENINGEETTDWMVGPRGKVEVGIKGITGLVMDVYGESAPEDLSDRIRSSLGLDNPRGEREEGRVVVEGGEISAASQGRPRGRKRRNAEDEND